MIQNVTLKFGEGAFIDNIDQFREQFAKVPTPKVSVDQQGVFKQVTEATASKPGQGNEAYVQIGGGDLAFPVEYSVGAWFKWEGDYVTNWHMLFRFTTNDKPENQDYARAGDRTLAVFANS